MSKDDGLVDKGHSLAMDPKDDYFHPRESSPFYNESAWFGFAVPERELSGWLYFYHRPNMNLSVGGVAVWDPSGMEIYNCRYFDWGELQQFPADAEMFDFSLDNGLTVACREPLRQFHLRYDQPQFQLELDWTAIADPHGITYPPGGNAQWGSAHYDQAGQVVGSLALDGEEIRVDCFGLRDRSWGPRRVSSSPRNDYPSCFLGSQRGFHFKCVSDLPAEEDPFEGTTERANWGFHFEDGIKSDIVRGRRRCVERFADGRPKRTIVEAVDEQGRELHAEGTQVNWLRLGNLHASRFHCWSLTRWDWDGVEGWGESMDSCPKELARRFLRSK